MKHRQHILVAAFAVVLLYVGGDWLYSGVLQGPLQERRRKTERLKRGIDRGVVRLMAAREERKRLDALQARSLPSDVEVARSLYQAWLWELVDHVGFTDRSVIPSAASPRGLCREFSFSVSGRGTLSQVTQFLFEFYNAPHLHQIRSLVIPPVGNTEQFDLSIDIRALSLPGVDRKDRLATQRYDRLASGELADYDVIVQRNLFALGGSPDALEHAYLVGICVDRNDRLQVSFDLRGTGEKLDLYEGDPLKIGSFEGTVAEIQIDELNVIIESMDKRGEVERWLLSLGETLSEAHALPPGY